MDNLSILKDKAKPVVKQGRKATDLIKDSRVAKQDGIPVFVFSGFVTTSQTILSENNII